MVNAVLRADILFHSVPLLLADDDVLGDPSDFAYAFFASIVFSTSVW
jgi:hypothetical protein